MVGEDEIRHAMVDAYFGLLELDNMQEDIKKYSPLKEPLGLNNTQIRIREIQQKIRSTLEIKNAGHMAVSKFRPEPAE